MLLALLYWDTLLKLIKDPTSTEREPVVGAFGLVTPAMAMARTRIPITGSKKCQHWCEIHVRLNTRYVIKTCAPYYDELIMRIDGGVVLLY